MWFLFQCIIGIGRNSFQILIDLPLDAQSLLNEKDRTIFHKHDDYTDNFNKINNIYKDLSHSSNIDNIIIKNEKNENNENNLKIVTRTISTVKSKIASEQLMKQLKERKSLRGGSFNDYCRAEIGRASCRERV